MTHYRLTQQLAAQRLADLREQATVRRPAPKPQARTKRVRFLPTRPARVRGR